MAVNPNINNSLYAEFKDARPSWLLIGCAFPLGIVAAFGMLFNFCHGHFLFVFVAFSGLNFIEYQTAALFAALSVFGLGGIAISMFFTGFDRLICVLFPEKHSKLNLRFYLGAITFVCFLFSAALLYTLFLTAEQLKGLMISGCIVDIVQGPSVEFFAPSNLLTNLVTSAIYLAIGIAVKAKTSSSAAQANLSAAANNRRLLRSLFAIVGVNMGGYFLNTAYVVLLRPSIPSPITAWLWQVITGIPLNVSAASNGPILYFTSIEYRQAFRLAFPFLFKHFQKIEKPKQPQIIRLNTFTIVHHPSFTSGSKLTLQIAPTLVGHHSFSYFVTVQCIENGDGLIGGSLLYSSIWGNLKSHEFIDNASKKVTEGVIFEFNHTKCLHFVVSIKTLKWNVEEKGTLSYDLELIDQLTLPLIFDGLIDADQSHNAYLPIDFGKYFVLQVDPMLEEDEAFYEVDVICHENSVRFYYGEMFCDFKCSTMVFSHESCLNSEFDITIWKWHNQREKEKVSRRDRGMHCSKVYIGDGEERTIEYEIEAK
ncbi:hypothetical protein niasHT_027340 [Heterodera trifolii]|uniref:Uncharacterized protein n=1 Tax=Heterodera trifolii TaxID=157864 RepID=A0ABD2JTT5_9BILA